MLQYFTSAFIEPMPKIVAITCLATTCVWPMASMGQSLDEKTIHCLCSQKVGSQGPRSIGMCTGHYMGEWYAEKCGNDKECIVKEMNNGYGKQVVESTCK